EVGAPADPIQQLHRLQLRRLQEVVDRLPPRETGPRPPGGQAPVFPAEQVQRRAVDLPVVLPIEVVGAQELKHLRDRKRVEEDRSDDRHLGIEVVRWYPPCGEWKRGRHAGFGQRSCVTITLTCALTSRCSFSDTWCSPSVLMGSFMSILWRSISTLCCAFRADATSWLVIEPNALSSAPTFRRTTTVLLSIWSATACASLRSCVSRLVAASRSRFASASAPFPAGTASLRRRRKLRPYPSATSFT